MAKEPFMPLFFGDFLASTAEWEGEERALYLLLLGYQWSLGSLPEEPRRICKLVGWDWQLFERCWRAIAPKFQANAGRLLNQRLEQHRSKSHEISEKRAASGAIGGKASQANARRAREQMLDGDGANARNVLDPLSHPIPSYPKKSKRVETSSLPPAASQPIALPEFDDFRSLFPRRSGSQPWDRAQKAIRARLGEGHTWVEILDGTRRYAEFIRATGKERTDFVLQAATFVGPSKHFLNPYELPASKADARLANNLSAADEFMRRTEVTQ